MKKFVLWWLLQINFDDSKCSWSIVIGSVSRWSAFGGSVESLSVSRLPVGRCWTCRWVSGSVEDLSVGWWSAACQWSVFLIRRLWSKRKDKIRKLKIQGKIVCNICIRVKFLKNLHLSKTLFIVTHQNY